jgi:hypothetical protein
MTVEVLCDLISDGVGLLLGGLVRLRNLRDAALFGCAVRSRSMCGVASRRLARTLRRLAPRRLACTVRVGSVPVSVVRLALDTRLLPLDDMGQLMGEEPIPLLGSWAELARGKVNIGAHGKGARAKALSSPSGVAAGVELDRREVGPEARLHTRANLRGERRSSA